MSWVVRVHLIRYELRAAHEPAPKRPVERFLDHAAARNFLRELERAPEGAQVLADLGRATLLRRGAALGRDVADDLAAELVSGRLLVIAGGDGLESKLLARPGNKKKPGKIDPDDLFKKLERKDTEWIEIQLVDPDGNPVPNTRYVITTPDGVEHRGYTDSLGTARLTRIPGGDCKITFPDLDGREWHAA